MILPEYSESVGVYLIANDMTLNISDKETIFISPENKYQLNISNDYNDSHQKQQNLLIGEVDELKESSKNINSQKIEIQEAVPIKKIISKTRDRINVIIQDVKKRVLNNDQIIEEIQLKRKNLLKEKLREIQNKIKLNPLKNLKSSCQISQIPIDNSTLNQSQIQFSLGKEEEEIKIFSKNNKLENVSFSDNSFPQAQDSNQSNCNLKSLANNNSKSSSYPNQIIYPLNSSPSSPSSPSSSCSSSSSLSSTSLSSNKSLNKIYIVDGEKELSINQISELHSECENMPILILDLDNTLVHSTLGDFYEIEETDGSIIKIDMDQQAKLLVKLRPFILEFFKLAFSQFKVVMYTLGSMAYAKNVHQIFKEKLPEIFEEKDFLRIIAQPTKTQIQSKIIQQQSEYNQIDAFTQSQLLQMQYQFLQIQIKDVSKYFPLKEFQHRLLILDDNQQVYHNEWIQNIVFTKPYRYWNESSSSILRESDSFLLFTASLFDYLCSSYEQIKLQQQQQDKVLGLSQIYKNYKKSLLKKETLYLSPLNPNLLSLHEVAVELGAKIIQKPDSFENYKTIVQDQLSNFEESSSSFFIENQNDIIVSEDWIKYCYLLNCRVPYHFFQINQKTKYDPFTLELEIAKQFAVTSTSLSQFSSPIKSERSENDSMQEQNHQGENHLFQRDIK